MKWMANKSILDLDYAKYDFKDPEKYVFKSEKGLSRQIVEQISEMKKAAQLLLSKRRPDGKWNLEGDFYRQGDYFYPSGKGRKAPVAIDEIGKASKWITLNSL